jgi:hypothetical protein
VLHREPLSSRLLCSCHGLEPLCLWISLEASSCSRPVQGPFDAELVSWTCALLHIIKPILHAISHSR